MKHHSVKFVFHSIGILAIVLLLVFTPVAVQNAGAQEEPTAIPAEVGYIDHVYGAAVKPEPSADVAESKLWWNDGMWWGILFEPVSKTFQIYWLNWGTQSWRTTGTGADSRQEIVGGVPTGPVATRFDVLWDEAANKLYVLSHIKVSNPSQVNTQGNWGRLYRYSYDASTKKYTLDTGFPVTVNRDKTEVLVLDKDSSGRLWVTYVSRIPNPDPLQPSVYDIFVNYTVTPGNDQIWSTPVKLSTLNSEVGNVGLHDVSSVIAFGNNVGVMWSNGLTGIFHFAYHPAGSSPDTSWTVQTINITPFSLFANDHIKLVTNSAGQVFATIKTLNKNPADPLLGVIARDVNGTFTFHVFSTVDSLDTRPTLLLDESQNRLIMFASSNAAGGVICYKSMAITTPLSSMSFPLGNCSATNSIAPHFIVSQQYANLDNSSSSKRNVNDGTGAVVIATDDVNGSVYLHNVIGNPLAVVTDTIPARGSAITSSSLIISLTFSHTMNASTLNSTTVRVTGPGGSVPGTVSYDTASRRVTFQSNGGNLLDGTYQVSLTSAIRDTSGRPIYNSAANPQVLSFQATMFAGDNFYLPIMSK